MRYGFDQTCRTSHKSPNNIFDKLNFYVIRERELYITDVNLHNTHPNNIVCVRHVCMVPKLSYTLPNATNLVEFSTITCSPTLSKCISDVLLPIAFVSGAAQLPLVLTLFANNCISCTIEVGQFIWLRQDSPVHCSLDASIKLLSQRTKPNHFILPWAQNKQLPMGPEDNNTVLLHWIICNKKA